MGYQDVNGEPAGLDAIGWFIATSHQMLGHDKTAVLLGQPSGDRSACLLCLYERQPSAEAREAVIRALAGSGGEPTAPAG